ncbi:MAG: hypothetical protein QGH33_19370 [Pirellulaceae bacterium]|nr:hypothetical protein [Pirellulaceae bacterium]
MQPRIIREDGTPRSPWSIAITCYNGATSDFSFRFCSLQGAGSVAPDGDSRLPIVNETAGLRLVLAFFPQRVVFSGDFVLNQVEPGLYKKHRKRN